MGQKVLVTGATGVLGRRLVPRLVEAGHQVTAVVRSTEKAEAVRAAGGTPVEVDLFDRSALRVALAGHDSVVQMATNIPTGAAAADRSAWQVPDPVGGSGANILARSHRVSSQHLRDVSPWVPTIHCIDQWKELS